MTFSAAACLAAVAAPGPQAHAQLALRPTAVFDGAVDEHGLASLSPVAIDESGRIISLRVSPLEPPPSCGGGCNPQVMQAASSVVTVGAGAPMRTILSGDHAVFADGDFIAYQRRDPNGYHHASSLMNLSTGERWDVRDPSRTFPCRVTDVDRKGRVLCAMVDSPDSLIEPSGAQVCGFVFDPQTEVNTVLRSPKVVAPEACAPLAMSDTGEVVGVAGWRPVAWDAAGRATLLPADDRFASVSAVDISASGTILGTALDDAKRRWVVSWQGSERRFQVFGQGWGKRINAADVVAGSKPISESDAGGGTRAYLFDLRHGREIALLGPSDDETPTEAVDVNDRGMALADLGRRMAVFELAPSVDTVGDAARE